MAKTIDQIIAWLDTPSHRKCVLADIGYYSGSEQTMRLSTTAYYDGVNEYIPIIMGGISFSESLSADYNISISYGTLELQNTGGPYDHFLDYIWKRRNINLYLGDPSWPKTDFILIFSGLVDTVVSSGESSLQLTIVDKSEQLNEAITTRTLKDLSNDYTAKNTQEEKLLPVLFGEVFNLSPIIVDTGINYDTGPWTGTIAYLNSTAGIVVGRTVSADITTVGKLYQGTLTSCVVNSIVDNNTILYTVYATGRPRPGIITNLTIDGVLYPPKTGKSIEITWVKGTGGAVYKITDGINTPYLDEIIEVRDKAAPIEILDARSPFGEFMQKNSVFGTVTCSARSFPAAQCTVPNLIKYIVKNYGKNKLTDSDIDFTGISTARASYKAGIYVTERTNILEVCTQLAKSIGCILYYAPTTISAGTTTSGKLKLVELTAPIAVAGSTELNDSLMLEGTLQISEAFQVKPTIKLGYCKNYTQQPQDLALALNPQHGDVFKDEYWFVQKSDSTISGLYNDTGEVQEELTHLLITAEAEAEALKRLDLWKTPRQLITATYLPILLFVQLGQPVTIKSNRFGLSAGKPGIVYSINRDWLTGFVEIGVLV